MHRYLLTLASVFGCSGCQSFDQAIPKYEGLLAQQSMVIAPYSPEHESRHGPGFAVTMTRDDARKLGAPDGQPFKEELEKYLADERTRGNSYCPRGYQVVKVLPFKHWYTEIWVDCKTQ